MTRLSGNTFCTRNLKSNRQVFSVNSIGNTFSLEFNYFPLLNPFDSLSTAALSEESSLISLFNFPTVVDTVP